MTTVAPDAIRPTSTPTTCRAAVWDEGVEAKMLTCA